MLARKLRTKVEDQRVDDLEAGRILELAFKSAKAL